MQKSQTFLSGRTIPDALEESVHLLTKYETLIPKPLFDYFLGYYI